MRAGLEISAVQLRLEPRNHQQRGKQDVCFPWLVPSKKKKRKPFPYLPQGIPFSQSLKKIVVL